MDLGSRDYSLNFRGFEHDDPERVQRFKAFCEANFSLSPDRAHSILSSSATTVLTHSGSLEELEALAKVLREIGALVDVSEPDTDGLLPSAHLPSTQELHRLFARERDQTLEKEEDGGQFDEDSAEKPRLRSTLYLITANIDIAAQRKALRERAVSGAAQSTSPTTHSRKNIFAIALCLVGLVLAGAVAFIGLGRSSSLSVETPPLFGITHRSAEPRAQSLANTGPIKTLIGRSIVKGVSIESKVLVGPKSLSLSSLAISNNPSTTGTQSFIELVAGDATFRRAEGEPVFLKETGTGAWSGDVIVSIFTDNNGELSQLSRTYNVAVRLTATQSGTLELRDSMTGEVSATIPLASSN